MNFAAICELAEITASPIPRMGKNAVISCPLATVYHRGGVDRHPSLSVKVREEGGRSVAYCFSCGVGGYVSDVFNKAQMLVGGYEDAVAHIKRTDAGDFAAEFEASCDKQGAEVERRCSGDYSVYVRECSRFVPRYLLERGVLYQDVVKWRLGYDVELQRAVLPIFDESGAAIGASRRAIHSNQFPKYLDTPGLDKRNVFYGAHLIDRTRGVVHIVEGPLDAVFASRVLPNVVALMGAHTGMNFTRISQLLSWCSSVVLIPDGDDAGRQAVYGADVDDADAPSGMLHILSRYMPTSVASLSEGEDPASVPQHVLLDAVRKAEYFF